MDFAITYVSSEIEGQYFVESIELQDFILENQIIGGVPANSDLGILNQVSNFPNISTIARLRRCHGTRLPPTRRILRHKLQNLPQQPLRQRQHQHQSLFSQPPQSTLLPILTLPSPNLRDLSSSAALTETT
jgi:hypothetical protein